MTSASTTAVDDRYFGCPGIREYLMESTWQAFCTASVHSTARLVVAEETLLLCAPPRVGGRRSGRPSACCEGMSAAVASKSASGVATNKAWRPRGTAAASKERDASPLFSVVSGGDSESPSPSL